MKFVNDGCRWEGEGIQLPIGNCKTIFLLLRSKLAVSFLRTNYNLCTFQSFFFRICVMVFLPMFYFLVQCVCMDTSLSCLFYGRDHGSKLIKSCISSGPVSMTTTGNKYENSLPCKGWSLVVTHPV